jgi:hypothetical protein
MGENILGKYLIFYKHQTQVNLSFHAKLQLKKNEKIIHLFKKICLMVVDPHTLRLLG